MLTVMIRQHKPISLEVSFSCEAGELLALVGPSGSGKTSILRTIAGLQTTDESCVRCNAIDWENSANGIRLKTQKRKVGFVFQQYALFPHMTVLENVMLATQRSDQSTRRTRALHWLEKTNMDGLQERKPAQLSGGQKQRVALARALAREPDVLLLDEPFSAVDQQTRRKLYRELIRLRRHLSIPILLVTHDITEVQLLADSVCLIHKGQSLQQGAVQSVINQPASKEIARLLGHQNLFSATVMRHSEEFTHYRIGARDILAGHHRPDLQAGQAVDLLITPSVVNLDNSTTTSHNREQAEQAINRLRGSVSQSTGLGDELSLRIHLESVPKSLRFRVPMHIAQKETIGDGKFLQVRVLPEGIHAMPVKQSVRKPRSSQ